MRSPLKASDAPQGELTLPNQSIAQPRARSVRATRIEDVFLASQTSARGPVPLCFQGAASGVTRVGARVLCLVSIVTALQSGREISDPRHGAAFASRPGAGGPIRMSGS